MVVGHYDSLISSMANCQTSGGFQWFHPRRNEMQLKVGKCGLVGIVCFSLTASNLQAAKEKAKRKESNLSQNLRK